MFDILFVILASIGGITVSFIAYLFLFKKVVIKHVDGDGLVENETASAEETHNDLSKILIFLNNLKVDIKNCGMCENLREEVERIEIFTRATQKKLEIEDAQGEP